MSDNLEGLLEPSLQQEAGPHRTVLSVTAGFWISFFGGVLAPILWGMFNAQRLGTLRRDALLWVGLSVLAVGGLLGVMMWFQADPLPPGPSSPSSRVARFVLQLWAIALFGLIYLRHRREHRAANLIGAHYPSPWKVGLAMFAGATVAQIALTFGLFQVLR